MSIFDKAAGDYSTNSVTQFKASEKSLSLLKQCLKENSSVLDVGCGTGLITKEISTYTNGKVVGADVSENMIIAAKNQSNAPNIDYVVMSFDDIAYQNSFDCIFANSSFYYISNRVQTYKKLHNALKQNGHLVVQAAYRDIQSNQFMVALNRVLDVHSDLKEKFANFVNPIYFYKSETDFCNELQLSGFKVVHCETEEQVTKLPFDKAFQQYESNFLANITSEDNYKNKFDGFTLYCDQLRKLVKDELANQVEEERQLQIVMPRMYVVAKKR